MAYYEFADHIDGIQSALEERAGEISYYTSSQASFIRMKLHDLEIYLSDLQFECRKIEKEDKSDYD